MSIEIDWITDDDDDKLKLDISLTEVKVGKEAFLRWLDVNKFISELSKKDKKSLFKEFVEFDDALQIIRKDEWPCVGECEIVLDMLLDKYGREPLEGYIKKLLMLKLSEQ